MKSRNKGIALSYAYLIINMACGLFLSSYLIRVLGETEYGVYKTIASFANYLILLEFGTGTVMTRNVSLSRGAGESKERLKQNISTIWTTANILGIVIIAASVVMYFSLDFIYKKTLSPEELETAKTIFIFVVLHLLLSFYVQNFSGIILGYENYTFGSILKIARTVSRTLTLALLVQFWKYSLIIAIVDSTIALIEVFVCFIYCKKKFKISLSVKHFNKEIFLNVLPLALALFLQSIINQANNNVDSFLIGIYLSPEEVTFYSIALFIFNVFSSMCTVPISMYAPQVAKEMGGGASIQDLTPKLASAAKLTAIIGGSVLFGFIAAGKPFISALYGTQYIEANVWYISIILMIPSFLTMLLGVIVNVLDVLGKRIIRSLALMGTTLANIILTIFFLKYWGAIGAACATFICVMLGQVILMSIYYKKVIKINVMYLYKQCFKAIIPCQIFAAILGFIVSSLIKFDSLPRAIVALFAGGITYVAVFVLSFFAVDKDAKKIFSAFMKRIKNK